MFGPSNWAIFGVRPASHTTFLENFSKPETLLNLSQLTQSAVTRGTKIPTFGITPYDLPRMDEKVQFSTELMAALIKGNQSAFAETGAIDQVYEAHSEAGVGYAKSVEAYRLDADLPIYAFWFISNAWKDNSDSASLKEGGAYDEYQRPYKFLSMEEKKKLDLAAAEYEAPARKQYPVFVDFQAGRVYAEVTNDKLLMFLQMILKDLGAELYTLVWDFGSPTWVGDFLSRLYKGTRFASEFKEAAVDRQRFSQEESAQPEDPTMAKLLRDFFSMTEMGNETWVGLSAPASIRLYAGADYVGANTQTSATQLLALGDAPSLHSASLVFQEQRIFTRDGVERVYRTNEYALDLNENLNGNKVVVALLRGFDLPSFRSRIRREIKKSKEVPEIRTFWFRWLQGLEAGIRYFSSAVVETLELDAQKSGLVEMTQANDDAVKEPTYMGVDLAAGLGSAVVSLYTDGQLVIEREIG